MNKYKYIIWDWNGTLFNDVQLCVTVMNDILQKENLPEITLEQYRQLFDFPVKSYYRNLGFNFEKTSFEKLGIDFINEYNNRRFECSLNEGVRDVLALFQEQGKKQYVLSAREHEALINDLKNFEIYHYFEEISGLDNHFAAGKVHLGLKMMKENNINQEECLLIGDTVHDAEVAKELNIDCLLIALGHHTPERLKMLGVPVLNSFYELKAYFSSNSSSS